MERVGSSNPSDVERFLGSPEIVQKAYNLAKKAHAGQIRRSGDPYFSHLEATVGIITDEWELTDKILLAAAYVHDVTEDTGITTEEIACELGSEVANIVEGVSEFKNASQLAGLPSTEEEKAENKHKTLKKVLSGAYLDTRVALIKLADRLHNMRTLDSVPTEKQRPKAEETGKVHAKLAEAYGMWKVKTQLEDLSFMYIDPHIYQSIRNEINNDPRNSVLFIESVQTTLEALLSESKTQASVSIRKGGLNELYNKRKRLALSGEATLDNYKDIDDLISFRVILKTYEDCFVFWNTLREFYDQKIDFNKNDIYLGANRRENGYSAIHMVINSDHGPFEIALVIQEDEEFNNTGILSVLKKGKAVEQYKLKLVFTPSGEVVFLPKQATGVDFAYAINSQMGAQAESLLIDGKHYSIAANVPNASVIEVVVSEKPRRAPNQTMINYCLPRTRKTIEAQLKQARKEEQIKEGERITETTLKPYGIFDISVLKHNLMELLFFFGCQNIEDFHYKMAANSENPNRLRVWMNQKGISKESLNLTSIRLSGKNEKGLLNKITDIISQLGGDIRGNTSDASDGENYKIEIIVHGLTSLGVKPEDLHKILTEAHPFTSCMVV